MKRKLKNYVAGGIVFAFLLTLILPAYIFFNNSVAHAAVDLSGNAKNYGLTVTGGVTQPVASDQYTLKWLDAAHLELKFKGKDLTLIFTPKNEADNGVGSLKDQRNTGDSLDYGVAGWPCHAVAKAGSSIDIKVERIDIDIDFKPSGVGGCQDVGTIDDIVAADNTMSIAYFKWIDAAKIDYVDDGSPKSFILGDPEYPNIFVASSEAGKKCQDKLIVSTDGTEATYYELDTGYTGDEPADIQAESDCGFKSTNSEAPLSNVKLPLAWLENKAKPAGTGESAALSTVGGTESPSCESSGGPLSWLMCGIIDLLAGAVDAVHDNMILPLLKNPRVDTSDTETGAYKAWTSFRNIANIILLFGLLFVVFGQSLGMDAYTAKKMMPRVLVAAILINLSYYLIAIANDITAVLGAGVSALIRMPFKLNDTFSFQVGGVAGSLGLLGLFASGAAWAYFAGGAQVAMALFALVLVPIFLAILGAAVVLILRRGILLLLLIISPIAFALIAIPGGEKYFSKYRSLLFSTLLVYPLFEAIWAISQVLATTISKANGRDSIIGLVATLIALFAPMFMIPFTFKLAGGLMGNIMNTAKGASGKFGALGKNRYNEKQGLIRKSMHERGAGHPNSPVEKRVAFLNRRHTRGSRLIRRIGDSTPGARRRADGGSDATPEAALAGEDAERAVTSSGGSHAEGIRARRAAAAAHTAATQGGVLSPAAANAAARAAGVASRIPGGNTVAAGQSAGAAYDTAMAAGHPPALAGAAADIAANSAGAAAGSGRSANAATTAGAVAASTFVTKGGRPTDVGAAHVAGEIAANVHDVTARSNGNNHVAARARAESVATEADGIHTRVLGIFGDEGTARTGAVAASEAILAGHTVTDPNAQQAVNAAVSAQRVAVSAGNDPEAAHAAGLAAGRPYH